MAIASVAPQRFHEAMARGLEAGDNRIRSGMHSALGVMGVMGVMGGRMLGSSVWMPFLKGAGDRALACTEAQRLAVCQQAQQQLTAQQAGRGQRRRTLARRALGQRQRRPLLGFRCREGGLPAPPYLRFAGTLDLALSSSTAGTLVVSDHAALAGALKVTFANGYTPKAGA